MQRPPIAVVAGLLGFAVYLAAAMIVADLILGQHWLIQSLYFVIAGTLWVIPIRWLMYWSVHQR